MESIFETLGCLQSSAAESSKISLRSNPNAKATKALLPPSRLVGQTRNYRQFSQISADFRLQLEIAQKNSRRLELLISKNTPHGRWGQGPGSVDPRFPARLPFPLLCAPGKIFQQFSRDFPGVFLANPRTDPRNSHSLLEFSELQRLGAAVFR